MGDGNGTYLRGTGRHAAVSTCRTRDVQTTHWREESNSALSVAVAKMDPPFRGCSSCWRWSRRGPPRHLLRRPRPDNPGASLGHTHIYTQPTTSCAAAYRAPSGKQQQLVIQLCGERFDQSRGSYTPRSSRWCCWRSSWFLLSPATPAVKASPLPMQCNPATPTVKASPLPMR